MERPKLSEEEASRLFHSTFLILSQQNLAQKHKTLKNQASSPPSPPFFPQNTSPKMLSAPQEPSSPLPQMLLHILQPSESPQKGTRELRKEWSMSKSSSNSEEPDPERRAAVEWKGREEDSEQSSPQVIRHSDPSAIISEMEPLSPSKSCQMQEEHHESLYVQSMMKELKRDLEISSRGKICKTQQMDSKTGQVMGYSFYCRNDTHCPFSCVLRYTGHRNSKNQKLFRLITHCDTHAKACIEEEEEIAFMRLTKSIDQLEPAIIALLTHSPQLKPKDILSEMEGQAGEEGQRLIYRGLASKHYHKAAKKYFDNLIYKIKTQMGLLSP